MSHRLSFALLSSIALFSTASSAAAGRACSESDLNRFASLSELPVRDQKASGLCYAHASASLLEFEIRSRNLPEPKTPLSAVDLALVTHSDAQWLYDDETLNSGKVAKTLGYASRYGVSPSACSVKQFKKLTGAGSNASPAEALATLDRYYALDRDLNATLAALQRPGGNCRAGDFLRAQTDYLDRFDSTTAIVKALLTPCRAERVKLPKWETESSDKTDDSISRTISDGLNLNKPVALSFCAEIFKMGYYGETLLSDEKEPLQGLPCGSHALIVSAQRKNAKTGKCEYLLRNSWGADWKPDGFVCACKDARGGYHPDCGAAETALTLRTDTYNRSANALRANPNARSAIEKRAMGDEYRYLMNHRSDFSAKTTVGCWLERDYVLPNSKNATFIKP